MKAKITIVRLPSDGIETLSNLVVMNDDKPVFGCASLELPWKNNATGISCIFNGIYKAMKVPATKKIPYEHILLLDVPGRDGICIHYGNYAAGVKVDIEGCIIVGSKHADINNDGNQDVIDSRITFDKILLCLPNKFTVEIK